MAPASVRPGTLMVGSFWSVKTPIAPSVMSKVEPLCSVRVAPLPSPPLVPVMIEPLPGCGDKVAPPATVIAVSSRDEPAASTSLPALIIVGPV